MKRAILALLILSVGTTVFCALRHTTNLTRNELTTQQQAWQAATQQVADVRLVQQTITERWSELKRESATQPPVPQLTALAEKILGGGSLKTLTPDEREQLLAELGFNWNTTGDYLIVSKKSLEGISFRSVRAGTVTDAVRAALALSPIETATIEETVNRLESERTEWAKAHLQREEPDGLVVAKYSIPGDVEMSQAQSNAFTGAIYATLGAERGALFRDNAWGWMDSLGMLSNPDIPYGKRSISLTVRRYGADRDDLGYTLQQGYSMMSASVLPWQPLPEAFRAIFPGGWPELAQREGFQLPEAFKKAQAR